jgi:hypothetical protein
MNAFENRDTNHRLTGRKAFNVNDILKLLGIIAFLSAMASLVTWKLLAEGVIFENHDLWIHIHWLQHFSKQLSEGIVYPRWLAGTNYGYGSPNFVFYPPLVYYVGSAIKALGFNAERTIVILFWLAIFLAGGSFYLLFHQKLNRLSVMLGAVLYMAAPYGIYNLYNRGALPETWAFFMAPLLLWATEKALRFPQWRVVVSLGFALLTLTHVPSLLLITLCWGLYLLMRWATGSVKFLNVLQLAGFAVLGFGLAAFYLIPAIFEQRFVNLASMKEVSGGYAEHLIWFFSGNGVEGHLKSIYLYGLASSILFVGLVTGFNLAERNFKEVRRGWGWFLFVLILAYLMTGLSGWLWASSSVLQMVQFPWRLLSIFSFGVAGMASLAVEAIGPFRQRQKALGWMTVRWLALGLIVLTLGWTLRYSYIMTLRYPGVHNPGDIATARATGKWPAIAFDLVTTAIHEPYANKLDDVPEYLPLVPDTQTTASGHEPGHPPVEVISGQASFGNLIWESYVRQLAVTAQSPSILRFRLYYYPAWKLFVDDRSVPLTVDPSGTILVSLDPGTHSVRLQYGWTPSFRIGVMVSIACLLMLLIVTKISSPRAI